MIIIIYAVKTTNEDPFLKAKRGRQFVLSLGHLLFSK